MGKIINKYWKLILVIGGIVFYLGLLAFITVTDASNKYDQIDNLLSYSDFSVSAGEKDAHILEDALAFTGSQPGDKVFSASVQLTEIELIQVEFTVTCLEQSAGTTLHVDLCAENYDSDEQEFTATLQAGENVISGIISVGANAPDEAKLRIFTLDPAGYDARNLSIAALNEVDHSIHIILSIITMAIGLVLCCCGLITRAMHKLGKKANK